MYHLKKVVASFWSKVVSILPGARRAPLIFISYATPDLALAEALSAILRKRFGQDAETTIFVAARSIEKGAESRRAMLHDALRTARVIVPICTARSLESRWLWFESGAGFGGDKLILPLCIGIDPGQIPEPLGMYQATRLTELSALLRRVAKAIGRTVDDGVTEEELASLEGRDGVDSNLESTTDELGDLPTEFPDLHVEQPYADRPAPLRAAEFFTVWVFSPALAVPNGTVTPRQEDHLLSVIRKLSPDDAGAKSSDRGATYVSFESRSPDLWFHRKWRFWADGYFALSSTVRDRRSATTYVGQSGMYSAADLALDLTYFFLVVGRMQQGPAKGRVRFLMHPFRLELNLSPSHPQVQMARLGGVEEPVPRQRAMENARELDLMIDVTTDELRDAPDTMAAKLVAYVLRHYHGARVDDEQVGASIPLLVQTVARARRK